ncbi:MAG: hypothetical protein GTN76_08565, partial [Candidatus Aenigmarchaeota archaeon]|nr:hypothetical protein [Candidatus Aenigmarchaeota archaeon]
MGEDRSGKLLKDPNFRKGLEIFVSRPISLIAALILSIVICLITFMLFTPPVIAGYYYAVKKSRREQYFIDLNNITITLASLFRGMENYFVQSYVFGIPAFLSVLFLYTIPLIGIGFGGESGMYIGTLLLILWLPAFFLSGIFIFQGYPYL